MKLAIGKKVYFLSRYITSRRIGRFISIFLKQRFSSLDLLRNRQIRIFFGALNSPFFFFILIESYSWMKSRQAPNK